MRTKVASRNTATASPMPTSLITSTWPVAKPTNTRTITAAAEVMMRPDLCSPLRTATSLGSPRVDVLLDARQQEHLVVHGQAEAEGDDHHEHRGLDAAVVVNCSGPWRWPSAKIQDTMPSVAPSESALMTSVFTGTSSDPVMRNSSTNVASTTSPSAHGAPSLSECDKVGLDGRLAAHVQRERGVERPQLAAPAAPASVPA